MHTKCTWPKKERGNTQKILPPSTRSRPIYEVNHIHIPTAYIHPNLHREIVKENIFYPLNKQFLTIKESLISFLPNRPKNTKSGSPSLNTPIYKRVIPPKESLPN